MKALLLLAFSQALWANTLIETQTAVGIANTLQGTAQVNPQEVLNQVKENVDNYEQAQEQKISAMPAPQAQPAMPNPQEEIPEQRSPQSEQNNPLDQATLSDQQKEEIQNLNQAPEPMENNPPPEYPEPMENNPSPEYPEPMENNPSPEYPEPMENNPPPDSFDMNENSDYQDINELDERLPKEEYFQTDRIIEIEDKPIDYKAGTQIFYKKDCLPAKNDCKRSGAVFTNIKSVIFNYAHSRGSFSKNKESK